MKRVIQNTLAVAAVALLAAGCSNVRLIDSDVTAFSTWQSAPPGPGTPYRFERLPSQQSAGPRQDTVESIARTSLARVGMELNPTAARYSVQTTLNTQVVDRGIYGDGMGYGGFGGFGGFGSGVFLGGGSRGSGVGLGMSFPLGASQPSYFRHELTLQMRDLGNNQVAFETRAVHEGVSGDTLGVMPAMMDAALTGFPQPPQGTRRINVEIPR